MFSILVATVFPWLCVMWFPLAFFLVFGVDTRLNLENIDRTTPEVFKIKKRASKNAAKFMIIPVILCLVMSAYFSIDLFVRDFTTCEVSYVYSENGSFNNLTRNYHFDNNGEKLVLSSLREKDDKNYSLTEGERYTVTYSKRTEMIVDIAGEEKTPGEERPLDLIPVTTVFAVMIVGIAGCVLGVFRIRKRKEY
jgi:hypothetical protein